jgi:hypothetical protein
VTIYSQAVRTRPLTVMQFLQRILPPILVIAAVAVLLATFFSDHKSDYGSITLPQGGVVDLPEGKSTIYAGEIAINPTADPTQVTGTSVFTIAPVDGGAPAKLLPPEGDETSIAQSTEALTNRGALASVDAPKAGEYEVSGGIGNIASIEFTFGRSSFAAVVDRWMLWGGLLLAAIVIALLPKPRHRPSGEGWQRENLEDARPASGTITTGDGAATPISQAPFSPYKG